MRVIQRAFLFLTALSSASFFLMSSMQGSAMLAKGDIEVTPGVIELNEDGSPVVEGERKPHVVARDEFVSSHRVDVQFCTS